MEQEIWKPIKGFEGYEISNLGRVYSQYSGKILSPALNYNDTSGYWRVSIKGNDGKYHTKLPSTSVRFMYGRNTGKKIEANDIFKFDFTKY